MQGALPVKASSKRPPSCSSSVPQQGQLARNCNWDINPLHNILSILTSCQTSECAWYGFMEQAVKQTQLLLWHVKGRERPAGFIFASKLSFMTGHRRKMCRAPPLFIVQIKVTQDLNNSIWSCDSMRSKFFDFASQDADSGTFLTSSVFTLPVNKNSQSQCVMFGSQYSAVCVSLFEYHQCKKFKRPESLFWWSCIFLVAVAELWRKKEGEIIGCCGNTEVYQNLLVWEKADNPTNYR